MRMNNLSPSLSFVFFFFCLVPYLLGQKQFIPNGLYTEPAISPDGKEIAFVSAGDIWTVPVSGGTASLLISHPAYEARPMYSPDGKSLAFVSSRTGNGDLYLLSLETGTLKRLTYDDGYEELSAWSADSKSLFYHSSSSDIAGMNDIWKIDIEGGTPVAVTADTYATEYHGSPSPDGKLLAFVGRGMAAGQWWRKGSSHLDQTELWTLDMNKGNMPSAYKQVTEPGARQVWPMWERTGKGLYFVSDRNGAQNIWYTDLTGDKEELTAFKNGRVLWPTFASESGVIVFERDFNLWKFDVNEKRLDSINIVLKGAANRPEINFEKLNNDFRNLTVSPDGSKAVFVARGKLFATDTKKGGEAIRFTSSTAIESNPLWSRDSKKVYFTTFDASGNKLYEYDFTAKQQKEIQVQHGDLSSLVLSPEGSRIAYLRNNKQLVVLSLDNKKEQVLYNGFFGRMSFSTNKNLSWSPDGDWIAFAKYDDQAIRNIAVIPSKGGEAKPISYLANSFGGGPDWSADGRYVYFSTSQRTEQVRLAQIDLSPKNTPFQEDEFYKLFQEEDQRRKQRDDKIEDSLKVKINFDNVNSRLKFMPFDASISDYVISDDGKKMAFTTRQLGQHALYLFAISGEEDKEKPRLLNVSNESKSALQFTRDGNQLFFMQNGRINHINLSGTNYGPVPLAVTASMEVDFEQEKRLLVYQAWDIVNRGFYDDQFHGVDWAETLQTYQALVEHVQTSDELRRVLNLMVGELNSSHMGVSAPASSNVLTARLGIDFDSKIYSSEGKFVIKNIIPNGPASMQEGITTGDQLISLNGKVLKHDDNLQMLLENKIGRKLDLEIKKTSGAKKEFSISPITLAQEKQLRYRQWVETQKNYVDRESKGRLGYVHMLNMSAEALEQLYLDISSQTLAKEGVIIDIRNNNGGFVNAYALDVFARKPYLNMTGRDMPEAPARLQLGQRALQKPTVLVINQHSLSDAEDFTEGYKALGLGKVIGEPTAGWIIFTSAAQLLDGSNIRLPFSKITDNKGENMELNPRQPDIYSHRNMGESYGIHSAQLDEAMRELLKELE